jgi:hypothetical protein
MPSSSSNKIRVTNRELRHHLGSYDRKGLKWDPVGFQVESDRLEAKLYPASVQQTSLEAFTRNPKQPMNYFVAGSPDDKDARYFAAYLAQIHMEALGLSAHVRWESVIGNFQNPALDEEPSLLIMTNLTPRSSNLKYEKARDLIERHSTIPKIIVVAGEDPISFAATRLFVPCHALAYFGSSVSKTFTEVV